VDVADQGTTIVLATHDYEHLAEAVKLASVHLVAAQSVKALDPSGPPQGWTERMQD
jgi:hypothetical protein